MKQVKYFLIYIFTGLISFSTEAQNIPDGSALPTVSGSGPGAESRPSNYINLSGTVYPTKFNYSRKYVPLLPMTSIPSFDNTKNLAVHVVTNYMDGFGLPLMAIKRNGSSRDIIQPFDLRTNGKSINYLPYPDSAHRRFRMKPFENQASYYLNKFPNEKETAYSKTELTTENGVKVTKRYAPGLENVGTQHGTTSSEHTNSAWELPYIYHNGTTICKSNMYPANSLLISKEVQPHGQEIISYHDKYNRLLCKKVKDNTSGSTSGYLITYYVYNELGKLMYIVPPKASEQLFSNNCITNPDELCFAFKYDEYGSVIEKHTPGKDGPDELIYDVNYKPVMSRSANMANDDQWAFTIYDKQGRAVISGIYTGTESTAYWRDVVLGNVSPISRGVSQEQTLEYWLKNYFTGTTYPTTLAGCVIHAYNYYDSYTNVPAGAPTSFDNSFNSDYLTGPGMVTPQPYMFAHGHLVASKTRILDNGVTNNFSNTPWITSVYFYDELGRTIQTHTLNPWNTNDWDVTTIQYNFSGKVVLDISEIHMWPQSNKPVTKIMNKYIFGSLTGRLETVQQQVDAGAWQPLSGYLYDEMGAVKVKWLGNVEEQIYSYDIRGNSTGINADSIMTTQVVSNTKTFFSKLHYDHGYSTKRYDGAISGFMWRTRGSDVMSYGYGYDDANRMTAAEFRAYNQNGASVNWNKTNIDFTVSGIDYDVNGNMEHMNQRGYDAGMSPVDIDLLTYTYDNGNKLMKVEDGGLASAPFIMDFDNATTGNNNDYDYDLNGNLKSDANKGITNIVYNHMDLPLSVTGATGTVQNIYSASGTLLQKTITENGTTDVYRYWGPFIFKNDDLDHMLQPEGRARYDAGNDEFTYDFFVKDHIGNVRTVVEGSSSYDQIEYHAGWEIISANVEESMFSQIGSVRNAKPIGVPLDVHSGKLNGSVSGKEIGAAILVHTMAGDQFNLEAYGYYEQEEPNGYTMYTMEEVMLNSLTNVLTGSAGEGGEGGSNPTQVINSLLTSTNYTLYNNLKNSITNTAYPRAYLNYLVFNEQYELQPQYSQVIQIQGGPNSWHSMELPARMTMQITGYLLAYLSNESPMDVWVDNEYLIHYESNLLEEKHYYPHGLVIEAGSQGVLPENDYLHQGKQLQKELGMELYDFHARQYDPQIGRFWGIDPADQFPSGYTGMGNDPANMIDPTGMYALNAGIDYDYMVGSDGTSTVMRRALRETMYDYQLTMAGMPMEKLEMATIDIVYSDGAVPIYSEKEIQWEKEAEMEKLTLLFTNVMTQSQKVIYKSEHGYEVPGFGLFLHEDGDKAEKIVELFKKGILGMEETTAELMNLRKGKNEWNTSNDNCKNTPGCKWDLWGEGMVAYQGKAFGGTNFIGPGPDKHPSELGLKPVDAIDAAAYQHDIAYFNANTGGAMGAIFDRRVITADLKLVNEAKKLMDGYKRGEIDKITGFPISERTYNLARVVYYTFTYLSTRKIKP